MQRLVHHDDVECHVRRHSRLEFDERARVRGRRVDRPLRARFAIDDDGAAVQSRDPCDFGGQPAISGAEKQQVLPGLRADHREGRLIRRWTGTEPTHRVMLEVLISKFDTGFRRAKRQNPNDIVLDRESRTFNSGR